jgi:hypothetical protein
VVKEAGIKFKSRHLDQTETAQRGGFLLENKPFPGVLLPFLIGPRVHL